MRQAILHRSRPHPSCPHFTRQVRHQPLTSKSKSDAAIGRGVKYLEEIQQERRRLGRILELPLIGPTALAGLTLLECGAARNDPHVVKAASLIRKKWVENRQTYELSLMLLFLDKLGEKKDKPIIQAMALRLVRGQDGNGGWGYNCPILTNQEATNLLNMLQKNRPKPPPVPIERPTKGSIPSPIEKGDKSQPQVPLDKGDSKALQLPVDKGDKAPVTNPGPVPPTSPKSPLPDRAVPGGKSGENDPDDDEFMLVGFASGQGQFPQ